MATDEGGVVWSMLWIPVWFLDTDDNWHSFAVSVGGILSVAGCKLVCNLWLGSEIEVK